MVFYFGYMSGSLLQYMCFGLGLCVQDGMFKMLTTFWCVFLNFMVSCRRGLLYMVRGFCSKVVHSIGCCLGCTLGTSLVVLVSLTVGATVLLGIVVLHLTSQANVAGICFSSHSFTPETNGVLTSAERSTKMLFIFCFFNR